MKADPKNRRMGMALKALFHDIADVPEKFRELYSEN